MNARMIFSALKSRFFFKKAFTKFFWYVLDPDGVSTSRQQYVVYKFGYFTIFKQKN